MPAALPSPLSSASSSRRTRPTWSIERCSTTAAGNVTRIVDGVNSETVDYTYDDLDRLLTASVPTGESFAYDTIGNMTSKAGTTLDYGTTAPKHAVKSHGTTTYTYDANGSMTAEARRRSSTTPSSAPSGSRTARTTTGRPTTATASAGSGRTPMAPSTTSAATSASWPLTPTPPTLSRSTTALHLER